MADMSDLHPAVVHALRTGSLEQVRAAGFDMEGTQRPKAANTRSRSDAEVQTPVARKTKPVSHLDEDDFYEGFRGDPLGWRQ